MMNMRLVFYSAILVMLFSFSVYLVSQRKIRKIIPKHKRIILINNVEQPLFVNLDEIRLFFSIQWNYQRLIYKSIYKSKHQRNNHLPRTPKK